ncbi:hypothetical protein SLE2022_366160 [Rubroshorea leprosula]
MADIAILVAEEYERRIKNSRKENEGVERVEGQVPVVSSVSVLAGRMKARLVGHQNMDVVKRFGLEPKSQIALAASNGFFSA